MMNPTNGAVPSSPQAILTRARFLLIFVEQSIQAVINQARGNNVAVSETMLVAWQALLMMVISLLNSIAVPLIFPPPRWAQMVSRAITLVTAANQTLAGIPVASTRIFPPQPGQATVSVQTLQQVQNQLRMAIRALEAAEAELGTQGG